MRKERAAAAAMAAAETYEAWSEAAGDWERLTGADRWRREPESRYYHEELILEQLETLNRLKGEGDIERLVDHLHESLHRSLGDLTAPELYQRSPLGTKHLIEEYLETVVKLIEGLVETPIPGFDDDRKRQVVSRASRNFGRSALLLSGGATLGFYHLGVVKALWRAGVLPDVISGASMGAMIAAGVGARDEDELAALFADDVPPIERTGLRVAELGDIRTARAVLDPDVLLKTIEANCGDYTFAEAFARSGRVLNISVAPTRTRQKPRLLNHQTAPDVLVKSAALASSAVPGLFPPTVLMRRSRDGGEEPYIGDERWIDGSFGNDLPMARLGRLCNVNHFIVSQVNPHVLPFADTNRSHPVGFVLRAALGPAVGGGLRVLGAARSLGRGGTVHRSTNLLLSLAEQEYTGDIDIHPRFAPSAFLKLLKNPSEDDLRWFVLEGARATWPKLAMIRDHTRIARCLARCEARLDRRAP